MANPEVIQRYFLLSFNKTVVRTLFIFIGKKRF